MKTSTMDLPTFPDNLIAGHDHLPVDLQMVEGVRSVLSLDGSEEAHRVLTPEAEHAWSRAFGVTYVQVAPDAGDLDAETIDRVKRAAARLERPLLVHSALAERALAVAAILSALETGRSGADAWERACELGVDPASTDLYRRIVREVERDTTGSDRRAS